MSQSTYSPNSFPLYLWASFISLLIVLCADDEVVRVLSVFIFFHLRIIWLRTIHLYLSHQINYFLYWSISNAKYHTSQRTGKGSLITPWSILLPHFIVPCTGGQRRAVWGHVSMTWDPKAPLCPSCGWIHKIQTPNPCARPNPLDYVTTKRKLSPRLPHSLRKAEARESKPSFVSFYPVYGFNAKTISNFSALRSHGLYHPSWSQ